MLLLRPFADPSGIYPIHNYTPVEQHLPADGVVRLGQKAAVQ
jgi:hypothetical protein